MVRTSKIIRAAWGLLLAVLLWQPVAAQAADFDEYTRLLNTAEAAHTALEGAPEEHLEVLRETAIRQDLALLEWLDTFMSSEEFATFPQDAQAQAISNRYVWEYNVSRLLVYVDHCGEARNRVRDLLDSNVQDAELRPRLTETYEEALECLNRDRLAIVTLSVGPPDAQVFENGVLLGIATGTFDVPLGEHRFVFQSPGYYDDEIAFTAATDGEEIELSGVTLELIPPPTKSPRWYEWSLWGLGGAALGTSIAYFIIGRNRQATVDAPPDGFRVEDPEGEQATIDNLETLSFVAGATGIVLIVTTTILYSTRDSDDPPPRTAWYDHIQVGPTSMGFSFTF